MPIIDAASAATNVNEYASASPSSCAICGMTAVTAVWSKAHAMIAVSSPVVVTRYAGEKIPGRGRAAEAGRINLASYGLVEVQPEERVFGDFRQRGVDPVLVTGHLADVEIERHYGNELLDQAGRLGAKVVRA